MNKKLLQHVILRVLKDPKLMARLSISEWNLLFVKGKDLAMLGRFYIMAKDHKILNDLPSKAQDLLFSAYNVSSNGYVRINWEMNRIKRALHEYQGKVVLLKGGAYISAGLKAAQGRQCSDVDILVSKSEIDLAEECFLSEGWISDLDNRYDQYYYRQLMHELPPLYHPDRNIIVDIHHSILPPTGRLKSNPEKLLSSAVKITNGENSGFYILSNEDMLLHSAAHAFYDGEMTGGLRNLLEQRDLIEEFEKEKNSPFWNNIIPRAKEMNLGRPLFYCLRYNQALLDLKIPKPVQEEIKVFAPNFFVLALMDFAVVQVLVPTQMNQKRFLGRIAAQALYIRSHFLRMPPLMLLGHLSKKFIRRLKGERH